MRIVCDHLHLSDHDAVWIRNDGTLAPVLHILSRKPAVLFISNKTLAFKCEICVKSQGLARSMPDILNRPHRQALP